MHMDKDSACAALTRFPYPIFGKDLTHFPTRKTPKTGGPSEETNARRSVVAPVKV